MYLYVSMYVVVCWIWLLVLLVARMARVVVLIDWLFYSLHVVRNNASTSFLALFLSIAE